MKFDNLMHAMSLTPAPHYHMPPQPISPHPKSQNVSDTPNSTTIPSDLPLINSTHATNPNIPTKTLSPPHLSHISSWKRIFRAIVEHTHNLSPISGSKRALNEIQPKLPSKHYAISQVVEDSKKILVKASFQPY